MDMFSHVLWTSMLARNRLWREEAIMFALLPDLGFFFILAFTLFDRSHSSFADAVTALPQAFIVFYRLLHSFVTLGIVALVVWKLQPRLLPALSAWALHILMDIPFHSGFFATRFLYPVLPNLAVHGVAWSDYRVLAISYSMLLLSWYYLEMRELAKHRRRERWVPDWIDRMEWLSVALINPKAIPEAHAAGHDNQGASCQVPGEDKDGPGEAEGCAAGALPPPQAGS